jgi:predicted Zn-dependent peptidase
LEDIIAGLMRVTTAEIQELARELFRPENWAATLMGPVTPDFSRILDF